MTLTRLVYDTESNGLLGEATCIHCIVTKDVDTKEVKQYGPTQIKQGLLALYNADLIIAHNQIGYDIPLIKSFYPKWKHKEVKDTLILSQLFWPDILGKHGLEAWGVRFGREKPPIEDWSVYTPEMLHRCTEDVEINSMLWKKCEGEMLGWDWSSSIELEQRIAFIHHEQVMHGVAFNREMALGLLSQLDREIEEIDGIIRPNLPITIRQATGASNAKLAPVSKPWKKDGTHSKGVTDWLGLLSYTCHGPFTKIEYHELDLGSVAQLKEYFLSIGWIPDEWNFKKGDDGSFIRTSPKLTVESLERANVATEVGAAIIKRMTLKHKRSAIEGDKGTGFLSTIRADGRVPAEATTLGTPTGRYRHKGSVCNIPRPTSPYGKEFRSLFGVAKGKVMVGSDLAGIEARAMVEYCLPFKGGASLSFLVLDGDFHQHNADLWGVDRNTAKSGLYCLNNIEQFKLCELRENLSPVRDMAILS